MREVANQPGKRVCLSLTTEEAGRGGRERASGGLRLVINATDFPLSPFLNGLWEAHVGWNYSRRFRAAHFCPVHHPLANFLSQTCLVSYLRYFVPWAGELLYLTHPLQIIALTTV